MRHGFGRALFY